MSKKEPFTPSIYTLFKWLKISKYSLPLQHQATGEMVRRRTGGQSHFLVGWRAPRVRPRVYPERYMVMDKKITTTTPPTEYNKEQGWNCNTEVCIDLKTLLCNDRRLKAGKCYQGVLRRDEVIDEFRCEERFVFTETATTAGEKRNPRVFDGQFVTVTRSEDGCLRLNFKRLATGDGFKVERYALGVYNEICIALGGLIEE